MHGHQPERPRWLHEPCPSWCAVVHADDDHPDDRHHDSAPVHVPVVLLRRGADDAATRPAPGEVSVVRTRRCHDPEDWVVLEESGTAHLVLDPASARRLAAALLAATGQASLPGERD
ncbi:hypothetical protein QE370_001271 [Aeromicrobium sp. SORGH_AS981]|uniref:DUF6907 domain-containing protein n=1 Tax=Aeromicrobium sp. SORGH_AS_0981 TaxID=3041802 RepID=UPI002857D279|nr:hypothetical protein [Aeromicrobium sp. SORGH_AS_0981]MDR6118087.1 hypothetical protein [Aeromicrobium sp. SORGH_AS_0981]